MFVLAAGAAGVAAGCSTTGTAASAPLDQGTRRSFSSSVSDVAAAARRAMPGLGLRVSSARTQGDAVVLVGETGVSAWSWGEVVRVVVRPTPAGQTEARVATWRKLAPNTTAKSDYAGELLTKIEDELEASPSPSPAGRR